MRAQASSLIFPALLIAACLAAFASAAINQRVSGNPVDRLVIDSGR